MWDEICTARPHHLDCVIVPVKYNAVMVERMVQQNTVAHDRGQETLEAKARWFQSLTLQERMDLLCTFTDLILSANPGIVE